jgi:3D (Asp-Asp-Asp) domain-containing protein
MKYINPYVLGIAIGIAYAIISTTSIVTYEKPKAETPVEIYKPVEPPSFEEPATPLPLPQKATSTMEIERTMFAKVTGYNTVPEQTDSTPCISANGTNICGRDDVVACPSEITLGTMVIIDGKNMSVSTDCTHDTTTALMFLATKICYAHMK